MLSRTRILIIVVIILSLFPLRNSVEASGGILITEKAWKAEGARVFVPADEMIVRIEEEENCSVFRTFYVSAIADMKVDRMEGLHAYRLHIRPGTPPGTLIGAVFIFHCTDDKTAMVAVIAR